MSTLRSGQATGVAIPAQSRAFGDLSDAPAPVAGSYLGFDGDGALAAITPPVTDAPSYGEVYAFNETGDALALTTQNTPYRWVAHTGTLVKGTGYVTWNDAAAPTGKRLTVGASGAGTYLVTATFAGNLQKHADLSMDVYLNAGAAQNITCDFHVTEDGSYVAGSASGLLALVDTDTVTMWFTASIGSNSINVKHANLSIVRIDA